MKLYFHYASDNFSNCYLVGNELTGQAVLIDPSVIDDKLLEHIEKNNKRKEAIERYEKIKSRWEESKNLIRILPDVYAEICLKLKALKKGLDFNIVDKTHELKTAIAYIGGQIPSFNYNIKNDIININNKIEWDKAKEISKKY